MQNLNNKKLNLKFKKKILKKIQLNRVHNQDLIISENLKTIMMISIKHQSLFQINIKVDFKILAKSKIFDPKIAEKENGELLLRLSQVEDKFKN